MYGTEPSKVVGRVVDGQGGPTSFPAGQDFGLDHRHPSIDYASYHLWVDNWGVPTLDFQDSFVAARLASARQMGKAVVAEEFGKAAARGQENITEVRDPFYASMFQAVEASLGARNALQGSLFWEWDPNGTNDSGETRAASLSPSSRQPARGSHRLRRRSCLLGPNPEQQPLKGVPGTEGRLHAWNWYFSPSRPPQTAP